jgi:hypothetical protein
VSLDFAVKSCLSRQNPKTAFSLENDFIRAIRGAIPEGASFALMEGAGPLKMRSAEMRRKFKGGVFRVGVLPLSGQGINPGFTPRHESVHPVSDSIQKGFTELKNTRFLLTQGLRMQKGLESVAKDWDAILVFPKVTPSRKWFLDHLIKN